MRSDLRERRERSDDLGMRGSESFSRAVRVAQSCATPEDQRQRI